MSNEHDHPAAAQPDDRKFAEDVEQASHDDRRSDLNDGVERPLGFYSTQAQAERNNDMPRHDADDPEKPTSGAVPADAPHGDGGFYSSEQQAERNTIGVGAENQVPAATNRRDS